mmetsp:Transcript_10945/g.32667  ORF Transcript_10945/g.32667 Transcript_10945/m.32667 type:complete len:253 (+) Transcript_10945:421-1179(+)
MRGVACVTRRPRRASSEGCFLREASLFSVVSRPMKATSCSEHPSHPTQARQEGRRGRGHARADVPGRGARRAGRRGPADRRGVHHLVPARGLQRLHRLCCPGARGLVPGVARRPHARRVDPGAPAADGRRVLFAVPPGHLGRRGRGGRVLLPRAPGHARVLLLPSPRRRRAAAGGRHERHERLCLIRDDDVRVRGHARGPLPDREHAPGRPARDAEVGGRDAGDGLWSVSGDRVPGRAGLRRAEEPAHGERL